MGTFLNLMQFYLEKDLMNISRDVKFNIVEDVLVKVTYLLGSYIFAHFKTDYNGLGRTYLYM